MKSTSLKHFVPQYPQFSDDQLLFQAKSGDQQAFSELCRRYKGLLKQRIFRIVRHREDSEDVLQETFLSAYLHLNSFRGTCRFSTWVTKIGINASIMLLRKRRKSLNTTSELVTDDGWRFETWEFRDPQPDPEQCYIANQTLLALRNAIQRLPPRFRGVMDLHYGKEHRLKDTAETLGITETAAKARALRGRRMLRRSLKENECWTP